MEARLVHVVLLTVCACSLGASHRTQNFIVSAPSATLSREVCEAAEQYRRQLAIEWLGQELPPWRDPCPITVHAGPHLGAGGATSFMFEGGRPFGWTMTIQGSRERILDSVLPHEVTHTIFATHFGRPLPRWADEGACTTVEHDAEKDKQKRLLIEFLTTGRGIAFNRMFAMKQYPQDILPLYAQGYSLARYLIAQGGKQKFIRYVADGMKSNNWPQTTRNHYGFEDLSDLQLTWLDWVRQGSPPISAGSTLLAQQETPAAPHGSSLATTQAAPGGPDSSVTRLASQSSSAPAARSSRGGWYARVRDQAITRGTASGDDSAPGADPARPTDRSAAASQSVSRPQPPARPRTVILEWSRASQTPANGPASRPQQASRTQLVTPPVSQRTLLR